MLVYQRVLYIYIVGISRGYTENVCSCQSRILETNTSHCHMNHLIPNLHLLDAPSSEGLCFLHPILVYMFQTKHHRTSNSQHWRHSALFLFLRRPLLSQYLPIGSMVLLYVVTCTINIPPMLAHIYHKYLQWIGLRENCNRKAPFF